MKLLGLISVGFDVKINCSSDFLHSSDSGKKLEDNETVHLLLFFIKKAYDSVRREVLYKIPIEFWVPMKLVRLIKMCLNKTYSKILIGKHLPDNFSIQNVLKQGYAQ
jgi:hypothetical protein